MIRRKAKQFLAKLGVYAVIIALAQICSLIMAIQDVFINDLDTQNAVYLCSSIPFVLILIFAHLPS